MHMAAHLAGKLITALAGSFVSLVPFHMQTRFIHVAVGVLGDGQYVGRGRVKCDL